MGWGGGIVVLMGDFVCVLGRSELASSHMAVGALTAAFTLP